VGQNWGTKLGDETTISDAKPGYIIKNPPDIGSRVVLLRHSIREPTCESTCADAVSELKPQAIDFGDEKGVTMRVAYRQRDPLGVKETILYNCHSLCCRL
jgi:hypothetical protein